MRLSIITINYNNAEGLRKTLASVAAQTYRDIEHIIVDGGSTDGSVDIIKEYEEKIHLTHSTIHVQWTSEKDKGIYNAMNKGVKRSTGEYVWILNSGDEVASPEIVEQMVCFLEKYAYPLLIGNIVKVFSEDRKVSEIKMHDANTPTPLDVSMLTFYSGTVPQDAAFVRRDLFEKYGYFDESMKICADWKLYLNMIALEGIEPMYVDIDVVLFDMSGISNANIGLRDLEKRTYLEEILPASVLKDYDAHAFEIEQMKRLRRRHLYWLVYFIERVLFKLEKWRILR